ncbi:hypothetical protein ES708_23040 [subsurface metagenome]
MNEPVRRKAILTLLAIFGGLALAVFVVVNYIGGF